MKPSMKLQTLCICLAALSSSIVQAQPPTFSDVPPSLRICGDIAGWPPFTYPSGDDAATAAGLNVELLNTILAGQQRSAEIVLLPWRRCLALAQTGEMDVLMDVLDTPVRRTQFLLPRPHYSVELGAVSLRTRNLGPLNDVLQLRQMRVCPMAGNAQFSANSPSAYVAAGLPATEEAAVEMLRSGRCDVVMHSTTILEASVVMSEPSVFLADEFTLTPLAWVPQMSGYLAVNRNIPYAQSLHELIDAGIADMETSGTLQQLRDEYLGNP